MSALRDRMIRDMTLRGFSPRTHKSYLAAVVTAGGGAEHLLPRAAGSWKSLGDHTKGDLLPRAE